MDIKIPFESEIEFKSNISEITKMSLEHDYNVNNGLVLGNFYVSGEYKTHEVSINTDSFNYTLPFEVELNDDILIDTIEFNIEDFSYDIKDSKILKINIVYSLKGEKNIPTEFEMVDEDNLKNELEYIDDFFDKVRKEDNDDKEVEKTSEELEEKMEEKIEEKMEEKIEDRVTNEEEKAIMDTIKDSDDTFVTYHIHIVKSDETLESICTKYNVSSNLISEYNNIDNINIGDKILIPKIDE